MKEFGGCIPRKHGLKARRAAIAALPVILRESDLRAAPSGERLKTRLAFETQSRVYLWITERSRSRV